MKDYTIVEAKSKEELVQEVKEMIQEGWEAVGSFSTHEEPSFGVGRKLYYRTVFSQAMSK